MRVFIAVIAVALLLAACSGTGTTSTTGTGSSSSPAGPDDPTAPTEDSLAANESFLAVPAGYQDCGETVLTSGWPTTTLYFAETELACINDAIASHTPSQYVYWGRDGNGGVTGTIIRVNPTGPLSVIGYTVDSTGTVVSSERSCADIAGDVGQPPVCADS
jgi:hypothetical protein